MQLKVITKISYQAQEGGPAILWDPTPRPVIDYTTLHAGFLGIDDGENSGFEFDIPTDDICQIKAGAFQNLTGQEVTWEINGDSDYSLQPDDILVLTNDSNDSDSPIWSVRLYTINSQVGAGGIRYLVAGDLW